MSHDQLSPEHSFVSAVTERSCYLNTGLYSEISVEQP